MLTCTGVSEQLTACWRNVLKLDTEVLYARASWIDSVTAGLRNLSKSC